MESFESELENIGKQLTCTAAAQKQLNKQLKRQAAQQYLPVGEQYLPVQTET